MDTTLIDRYLETRLEMVRKLHELSEHAEALAQEIRNARVTVEDSSEPMETILQLARSADSSRIRALAYEEAIPKRHGK